MGFKYEVQYRSGAENKVADALFRVSGVQLLCLVVSSIQSDLMEFVQNSYVHGSHLQTIIAECEKADNANSYGQYKLQDGVLRKKGKIVVGREDTMKRNILH